MAMSDPFLPAHQGAPDRDGREIDIDHDVDVLFDEADDDGNDVVPSSAEAPPFRTPVPGDTVTEEQLDEDLGLTPPPPAGE
ncbi:hypothetical protein [Microbacterium sp. 1P10AE]|uniref:hypothetical protein n=1 Tax=Microbacterium sp. 1P10AE TaxID=3132286 RepID=UPI0039A1A92B